MTYTSYIKFKNISKGMDYNIVANLLSDEISKVVVFLVKSKITLFKIEFVEDAENPIRIHFNNINHIKHFNENYLKTR